MWERPSGMSGISKSLSMNNITAYISREVCLTWTWTREVPLHPSQPLCSPIIRQNNPLLNHLLHSNWFSNSPVIHLTTIFCLIPHHREKWFKRKTCLVLDLWKSKKFKHQCWVKTSTISPLETLQHLLIRSVHRKRNLWSTSNSIKIQILLKLNLRVHCLQSPS